MLSLHLCVKTKISRGKLDMISYIDSSVSSVIWCVEFSPLYCIVLIAFTVLPWNLVLDFLIPFVYTCYIYRSGCCSSLGFHFPFSVDFAGPTQSLSRAVIWEITFTTSVFHRRREIYDPDQIPADWRWSVSSSVAYWISERTIIDDLTETLTLFGIGHPDGLGKMQTYICRPKSTSVWSSFHWKNKICQSS